MIRFSIVVPSFNQGKFLGQTLASVLAQGDVDIELIVVDGGSTDGTVEVVRRFSSRISTFICESDGGQAEAINKGMRLATGHVLGWLNSDDMYFPDILRQAAGAIGDPTKPSFVYGDALLYNEEKGSAGIHQVPKFDRNRLCHDDFLVQPSCFWTRKLWDLTGELDESLHFMLDWDWFLRASRHVAFAHVQDLWSLYRIHSGHKTGRQRDARRREVVDLVERYATEDMASAVRDVAPIADQLRSTCQSLSKWHLHRLRWLLFPKLYLRHGAWRVHEALKCL